MDRTDLKVQMVRMDLSHLSAPSHQSLLLHPWDRSVPLHRWLLSHRLLRLLPLVLSHQ